MHRWKKPQENKDAQIVTPQMGKLNAGRCSEGHTEQLSR